MLWSMFKTATAPIPAVEKLARTITPVIYKQDNLVLRNQALTDIEHTRDTLMRAEGWSGMLHFWPTLYATDPNGFYMLERNEEKVASISMVAYPKIRFAYVGMYVVPKELRGQGFGKIIFKQVLKHTEANRDITSVGLNCYAAVSPLYKALGFETYTVDDIWKLSGYIAKQPAASNALAEVSESMLTKVIDYDATVFGTERSIFLQGLISKANTASVFAEENNQMHGYGVISQRAPAQPEPTTSYRIGPIYARNQKIASELLERLIAAVDLQPEQSVFIESPGTNPAAAEMLTQFGFSRVASMNKMYRGTPPKFAEEQMFSYSSLAFGG
jgi:predicted GNAT family N-acyltransferase